MIAGLLVWAGCDSGEYNRRYYESLDKAAVGPGTRSGGGGGRASNEPSLLAATAAPLFSGGPDLKMRLSVVFDQQSTTPTEQPPFMLLNGLHYARKAFRDDGGKQLPMYCYVALMDRGGRSSAEVREELEIQLQRQFASIDISEENRTGPNGERIDWKVFSCTGNQSFHTTTDGSQKETLPGRFEVYMIALPTQEVVVGWRAPNSLDDQHRFLQAAQQSMATLEGEGLPK
jgi:hypothetical protein